MNQTKSKLKVSKEEVYQAIDRAVDSVTSDLMEDEAIKTGDIEPLQAFEHEQLLRKVADIIYDVMEQNK